MSAARTEAGGAQGTGAGDGLATFEIRAEHLASYWAVRHQLNVLFLTYEEMKRDHLATIARIAEFMGVALTAEEFRSVVHESSFTTMKHAGEKFDPGQILPWTRDRSMVRSRTSGSSSDLLTPDQQKQIDDYCRADLKRLGCDFPYDDVHARRKRRRRSFVSGSTSAQRPERGRTDERVDRVRVSAPRRNRQRNSSDA